MKPVKINKNICFLLFLLISVLVSLYFLFILKSISFYSFVFYAYFFTIAYFYYKDVKFDSDTFFKLLFFFIALIFISWGQHVFSFFDHQRIKEGAAFIIAGIVFLFFGLSRDKNFIIDTDRNKTHLPYEIISVISLVVVSFLLRCYNLENFFPGVWYDEAQNGAETLRLMEQKNVEFFITRYTYMPSMFFYISSVFVKLFGYNIVSLRLVSAFLGTLSIISFYFLLKEIFKDWKIAIFGTFLFSFSRWHINFSRIAFLGMQAVLLLSVFAYFYLKSLKTNKTFYAVISGIAMGLSSYTYSVVYFFHFFILLHCLYFLFKDYKSFFREKMLVYIKIYIIVIFLTLPLINFALKNPQLFFQRASDISFTGEIKNSKSLNPLIKNVTSYLLCFNFEGDYNARHNLYKKPLFDYLTGIFFIIGVFASLFTPGFRFFVLWVIIMFIPGIISITIETPQFYRIIGAMPAVFVIVLFGIYKSINILNFINNKNFKRVMYLITAISISSMNIYQYYFLYPDDEGTYLSFSPEASRIGRFINENKDYLAIVSPANNMYGFYQWEQKVVCDFITHGKSKYKYLIDGMVIYKAELDYLKKKGIVVILRHSDRHEIEKIEEQYGNRLEKKETYKNPFNNAPLFYCYYIKKDDIIMSNDKNLIIRME